MRTPPALFARMFAAIAAVAIVAASAAGGQEPAPTPRPAFEAATIKRATSPANPFPVMPSAPNRLRIQSQTLTQLIYTAYGNGGFNTDMSVREGPDWARSTAFFVEGVAAQRSTPQQLRQMLQTLLEDRFALKLRREMREGDALALMVDRPDGMLGPKVKPWSGTCASGTPTDADEGITPRCRSGYRPGGITLDGATMRSAAELLGLPQSRRLLGGVPSDRTGLTGRYTMELEYNFPPPDDAPSLSTALKEQWGLKVVKIRQPFLTIVVESAQLPTID